MDLLFGCPSRLPPTRQKTVEAVRFALKAEIPSADLVDALERNFNGISPEAMRRLLDMAQKEAQRVFGQQYKLPPPRHVIDVMHAVVRDLHLGGERDVNTTAFRLVDLQAATHLICDWACTPRGTVIHDCIVLGLADM